MNDAFSSTHPHHPARCGRTAWRRRYFRRWVSLLIFAALYATSALANPDAQAAHQALRIGVLKFGTVNWELQVVQEHHLAEKRGIDLDIVPLASENALAVALQGERVDLVVSDWLWAAHQRSVGRLYRFAPYSLSVGAVMVDPEAGIASLEDLQGRKLGIAGGPVDKTWLLLRAYAQKTANIDLANFTEPTYAAPPMINKLMLDGDLPAAVNFWHYNAQLQASGMQPFVTVEDMLASLGIDTVPPLLGWVFAEQWANDHREALQQFLLATYEAKQILASSDHAWENLRELIRPENEAVFAAIREGYRAGIPEHYGTAEIEAAQQLFAILAEEGGSDLIGKVQQLSTEVFWDGFRLP
ncbi:ABC transporter substrate-binding protein [Halomonas sp. WWR20]